MKKLYNDSEVMEFFGNLKAEQQSTVFSLAIDFMQQYNGRSKVECIILSTCDIYNLTRTS